MVAFVWYLIVGMAGFCLEIGGTSLDICLVGCLALICFVVFGWGDCGCCFFGWWLYLFGWVGYFGCLRGYSYMYGLLLLNECVITLD